MGQADKIMQRILTGASDTNIPFKALCKLLTRLEFDERIKGDHHIFSRIDVVEIINLQPIGSKAKAYQVKQVRNLFVKYQMRGRNVEQI